MEQLSGQQAVPYFAGKLQQMFAFALLIYYIKVSSCAQQKGCFLNNVGINSVEHYLSKTQEACLT